LVFLHLVRAARPPAFAAQVVTDGTAERVHFPVERLYGVFPGTLNKRLVNLRAQKYQPGRLPQAHR
jgi:hypothetical protein